VPAVPGYDIQEEVGRGTFGVVYRAVQTSLSRTVALKMLRDGAPGDPDELARFRREAHTVARLRHPNVVQVYEVGEAGGPTSPWSTPRAAPWPSAWRARPCRPGRRRN
jgi:serine/threonine protein kinase